MRSRSLRCVFNTTFARCLGSARVASLGGSLTPPSSKQALDGGGRRTVSRRCMSRSTSSLLLLLAVQAAAFPSARPHARSAPYLRTGHDRAPSGWRVEERRGAQASALLRLRGGGAARGGARSVAAVPEETGLRGDYGTLALLLLLYTLQVSPTPGLAPPQAQP